MRALLAASLLLASAGCLWLPDVERHGYTRCDDDAACAPGRFCDVGLCAPPPWNDEAFKRRQLLVVENHAESPLAAGAAVPVRVGEGGVISVDDLGADGRFVDFRREDASWRELPVLFDREEAHVDVWIPLSRDVPPGGRAPLAWIESRIEGDAPTRREDPAAALPFYDGFDGVEGPLETGPRYRLAGAPQVSDGTLNVADNQLVIFREPLELPVRLTFLARINGSTCENVFLGLYGDDAIATYAPPSAGIFVGAGLQADGEVAPGPDAAPTRLSTPRAVDGALHRFSVAVDRGRFEVAVDDEPLGALELRPPFEAEALYPAVDVDGACSVDVEALWASPLPLPGPSVAAEPPVAFQLLR